MPTRYRPLASRCGALERRAVISWIFRATRWRSAICVKPATASSATGWVPDLLQVRSGRLAEQVIGVDPLCHIGLMRLLIIYRLADVQKCARFIDRHGEQFLDVERRKPFRGPAHTLSCAAGGPCRALGACLHRP